MKTQPRFFKWSLVIGIIVVLNLFFNYTISLFYKEPNYNSYFSEVQVVEKIDTKEKCLEIGGQWREGDFVNKNTPLLYEGKNIQGLNTTQQNGYCNPDFTKQQEFNEARNVFQKNLFILLVILGVFSIILGGFLKNEILTLGLSWGGVLSLIIASMRYWSSADNLIKVLILACALGALVWLAIKKFGNNLEDSFNKSNQ